MSVTGWRAPDETHPTEGIPIFGGYFPAWRVAIHEAHRAHRRDTTQALAQQGAVLGAIKAAGMRGATPGEIEHSRSLRRATVDIAVAALLAVGAIRVSDVTPRRARLLSALERPLVAVESEGRDG